jgi:hypothetical protein
LIVINSHSGLSERWYVDISLPPPGHENNKSPVHRKLVISVAAAKKTTFKKKFDIVWEVK